ncbi:O-antigen ligase family protein [Ghiorsea bivora]|uniref:O-antigen ligase family protein n=1 Tax=Ghiorsea bivora TaxID=1485545 RepID=UPI00056EAFDE|nr:hypothetical protein [Ghiorsea bivora]
MRNSLSIGKRGAGSVLAGVRHRAGAFLAICVFIIVLNIQGVLVRNTGVSFLNSIDELFLLILFLFLSVAYLYNGTFHISLEKHFKYFLLFLFISVASVFLNSNNVLYGVFGFIEVTKGYMAYVIGRHLLLSHKKIILLEKLVLGLILLHIFVGFLQELLGGSLLNFFIDRVDVRYGITRVSGLFTSVNVYADYMVFFLALILGYRIVGVKISRKKFFALIGIGVVGIVLTVSRQAIAGLMIAVMLSALHIYGVSLFVKLKKLLVFFVIMIVIIFAGITSNAGNKQYTVIPEGEYLRYYATFKSLEILSDHPFVGVGGGYFGGSTARIFNNSKIYDEYDFKFGGFSFEEMATIDTLWPQIWAEYGSLGLLFYLFIFLSILRYNKKCFHVAPRGVRAYCWALHVIVIYLLVTSFAGPKLTNPVIACFFMLQIGLVQAFIKNKILLQIEVNTIRYVSMKHQQKGFLESESPIRRIKYE